MRINTIIKNAIKQYLIDNQISMMAFCEHIGISQSILSRAMNGHIATIRSRNWQKIYKYIAVYLPENYEFEERTKKFIISDSLDILINELAIDYKCHPNDVIEKTVHEAIKNKRGLKI